MAPEYFVFPFWYVVQGDVGDRSCQGWFSCYNANATIGSDSCTGSSACYGVVGDVGSESCAKGYSCYYLEGKCTKNTKGTHFEQEWHIVILASSLLSTLCKVVSEMVPARSSSRAPRLKQILGVIPATT